MSKEVELPRGDTFDHQMRRYSFSEGQVRDILAIYTEQQQAEIKRLRALAATSYAGLVAECDLPDEWADAFLAASEGKEFTTEGLLPVVHDEIKLEGELMIFVPSK